MPSAASATAVASSASWRDRRRVRTSDTAAQGNRNPERAERPGESERSERMRRRDRDRSSERSDPGSLTSVSMSPGDTTEGESMEPTTTAAGHDDAPAVVYDVDFFTGQPYPIWDALRSG